jgi:hypothetical protein
MIQLKAPQGQFFTDVWLASGKRVQPDSSGCIVVTQGDATPLMACGWQIVPPSGPR